MDTYLPDDVRALIQAAHRARIARIDPPNEHSRGGARLYLEYPRPSMPEATAHDDPDPSWCVI